MSVPINKNFDLIRRFFSFDLNQTELNDFDQQAEQNASFLQKIRLYRFVEKKLELQFGTKNSQKEQFLKEWQAVLENEDAKIRHINGQKWLKIAATFLLFLGASLWFFIPSNQAVSIQELALVEWKNTAEITAGGKRSNAQNNGLKEAVVAYRNKDFKAALALLPITSDNADALLIQGQCHFELKEMQAAVDKFQQVIEFKDGGEKDVARWYQALAFLYLENFDQAKANLNYIIAQDYKRFSSDAKELLKEIEKY